MFLNNCKPNYLYKVNNAVKLINSHWQSHAASQCWHYWHFGLDNSLLWGLSCALQGIQQHLWSLLTRCQQDTWQPKIPPDITLSLGSKIAPVENHWANAAYTFVLLNLNCQHLSLIVDWSCCRSGYFLFWLQ